MDMFYLLQKFQEFKKTFKGDPRKMIEEMMQNGRCTKEDYESALEKTKQFMNMFR